MLAFFVSRELKEFLSRNGIRHVTSAPYHLSSDGLAERAVQILKGMVRKRKEDTLKDKVSRALFCCREMPQTTTGLSPAELLVGRKLPCTLDLIHPDLNGKVLEKQ